MEVIMAGRNREKTTETRDKVNARARASIYTVAERKERLERIMCNSLDWWDDLAARRDGKGIMAAQDSYHKAVVELVAIADGTEGSSGITISILGADISLIEDGNS